MAEKKYVSDNAQLMAEWNWEKNTELGFDAQKLTCGSGRKVWWKCQLGHEWQSTVLNRNKGNNCPICSNQRVLLGYNDLATTHPWLADEWHFEKNSELLPTNVVAGSAKKVWWLGKCGHEWKAVVDSRRSGRGCPICANGARMSFPEKCVAFYLKQVFSDVQENARLYGHNGLELDVYIPSIHVGVEYDGAHWHTDLEKDLQKDDFCKQKGITLYRIRENKCKKYLKETWIQLLDDSIKSLEVALHTLINRICNEAVAIDVNITKDRIQISEMLLIAEKSQSLEKIYPDLARQWHPYRNGKLLPGNFSAHSDARVWWKGDCGHEWDASIKARIDTGCPICSNRRILQGYNDLATTHPHLLLEWDYEKNDIKPQELVWGSETSIWWKCEKGHAWEAVPYNKHGCPFCSNHRVLPGFNDLETLNPELALEWDYEKNDCLPSSVVSGSNKVVWWKCHCCGFEWKASIAARNQGRGCKKCATAQNGAKQSKTKLLQNGSLYDHHPELAAEWHYEKNKPLTPQTITSQTNQKVWWICSRGHEWESRVCTRSNGSSCPYCSGRKPIPGETDLQTKNPQLAAQWHPYKNDDISPKDVTQSSSKKVWWICHEGHEWQATVNMRNYGRGCPVCARMKKSSR